MIDSYFDNPKDLEYFHKWAFGVSYSYLESNNAMKFWNYIHGDILKLVPSGQLKDDVPKMIELWRKSISDSH